MCGLAGRLSFWYSHASDDTARGLEVIERSANIQLRLIEELLDLSRAATGQLGVTFSL